MKIIENNLFVEFAEMVSCGVNGLYISKAKSTGTKCWHFINDPEDNRKVLIGYEKLKDQYKQLVQSRFGNPYEYMAKQPIKNLVQKDGRAEEFFYNYKLDDDKNLPAEYVTKYTTAASWLNMLIKADADKKTIKKLLNLTIDQLYSHVIELLVTENVDLPKTYVTLRRKIVEYKERGYECLISGKFGNKNPAKICDEVSEALLLKYIEHHNKFDDEQVARFYNAAAVPLGYKAIDQSTVGVHRKKHWSKIQIGREGNAAFYDTFSLSIKQKRPSCPLARVENDDNTLDMYFWQEEKKNGKKEINYYKRVKMIVIADAHNDYPLGWAYGEEVSIELVRAAWLDAMHHINDLTGGWYLPHQIKNDRWALKALRPFYESISLKYIDNAQGSKRNRYIEQSFGKKWHKDMKEIALVNYGGYNITSAQKINADALQANLKNIPHISEAPGYVSLFIDKIRNRKNEAGETLSEQWKQNFFNSDISQERQISYARVLELFGTAHIVPSASNPRLPNSITNEGVVATLCGEEYTYDVPEQISRLHIGKKVSLLYSPLDLSRVLVTDNEGLRFVAQTTYVMSSAAVDATEQDNKVFWAKMAQKRRLVEWVAQQRDSRNKVLENAGIDAYGILQAGILTKEIRQEAEAFIQESQNKKQLVSESAASMAAMQLEYLKNKTDFNQYLD